MKVKDNEEYKGKLNAGTFQSEVKVEIEYNGKIRNLKCSDTNSIW